jgi:hypothetical protein
MRPKRLVYQLADEYGCEGISKFARKHDSCGVSREKAVMGGMIEVEAVKGNGKRAEKKEGRKE